MEAVIENGSCSEEQAREAFIEIMKAVHYLHSLGICHRNIKPESFLYTGKDSRTLKLINFGKSSIFGTEANTIIDLSNQTGSVPGSFKLSNSCLVILHKSRGPEWKLQLRSTR